MQSFSVLIVIEEFLQSIFTIFLMKHIKYTKHNIDVYPQEVLHI